MLTSVVLAFPLKWQSCCEVNFYCCLRLFFSILTDTTALLCWFDFLALGLECQVTQLSQLTGLLGKPRKWMSLLCVSGCFAILSLFTLFSSRIIKPCIRFWKLCLHSLFYCRLKAGALEGYQLINKLQSSHLVIKLSHWSKWKFRPLAFKWQFLKVWIMCLWNV